MVGIAPAQYDQTTMMLILQEIEDRLSIVESKPTGGGSAPITNFEIDIIPQPITLGGRGEVNFWASTGVNIGTSGDGVLEVICRESGTDPDGETGPGSQVRYQSLRDLPAATVDGTLHKQGEFKNSIIVLEFYDQFFGNTTIVRLGLTATGEILLNAVRGTTGGPHGNGLEINNRVSIGK